jgi:hypothetical protein
MRPVAERMGVPRALYTDFPLGRSLGKPSDQQFQLEVLRAAFALLKEPAGPVIRDFPVSVSLDDSQPLQCPLPPRFNADLHPAVDEAQALKAAYDRARQASGKTSLGMRISAEEVPDALEKFVQIANGEPWETLGFSAESIYGTVHDIRCYYEELACELAEGPIGPWATRSGFTIKLRRAILFCRRDARCAIARWHSQFGLGWRQRVGLRGSNLILTTPTRPSGSAATAC